MKINLKTFIKNLLGVRKFILIFFFYQKKCLFLWTFFFAKVGKFKVLSIIGRFLFYKWCKFGSNGILIFKYKLWLEGILIL